MNGDIQVGKVLERGPKKNVDNRIQYVGQIGVKENTQAKSRKKTKVKISSSDEGKEQRALKEEGPVPYIT